MERSEHRHGLYTSLTRPWSAMARALDGQIAHARTRPERAAELRVVGLFLIATVGWIHVLAVTALLLGASLPARWLLPGGLALALATAWWCIRREGPRAAAPRLAIVAAAASAFVALASWLSVYTFELTHDGNKYQAPGIVYMLDGWNPVYEPAPDPRQAEREIVLQIEHFPKFNWMAGAAFAETLGRVRAARLVNWVLLLAAALIVPHLLLRLGARGGWAAALTALIVLNPVVVYQSLSHYVDGNGYLLLVLALVSLLGILIWGGVSEWWVFAFALGGMIGTKFPYAVWAPMLVVAFAVPLLMQGRARAVLALAALSGFVFLFLGWEPYAVNTFQRGHPFFPMYGQMTAQEEQAFWEKRQRVPEAHGLTREQAMMAQAIPKDLRGKSRWTKWFLSTFSKPQIDQRKPTKLISPFNVRWSRFEHYVRPNTRTAGFGPLFAGMLVLALAALLLAMPRSDARFWLLLALPAWVAVTVFVHPEAWFARYVPQFWLVPVLAAAAAWTARSRAARIAAVLALALAFANAAGIAVSYGGAVWRQSTALHAQIGELKQRGSPVGVVFRDNSLGFRRTLADEGLDFREVPKKDCHGAREFVAGWARWCEDEASD